MIKSSAEQQHLFLVTYLQCAIYCTNTEKKSTVFGINQDKVNTSKPCKDQPHNAALLENTWHIASGTDCESLALLLFAF